MSSRGRECLGSLRSLSAAAPPGSFVDVEEPFRQFHFNTFVGNINTAQINTNLGSVAPDGTVTPNSSFGVANQALGSRTVQLQARFSF